MDNNKGKELPPFLQKILATGCGVGVWAFIIIGIVTVIFERPTTVEYDYDYNDDPYDEPQFNNFNYKGSDMNCNDFANAWEAQQFYEANGPRDPHDLDRDGDGRACEW